MAIVQKLDALYRSHLEMDKSNYFNSAPNLAWAFLQQLVGQNTHISLEGKVSLVSSETSSSVNPSLVITLIDVRKAYSIVLQLPEPEFNDLESQLHPDLFQRAKAEREALSSLPSSDSPSGNDGLIPPSHSIAPTAPLEPVVKPTESCVKNKLDIRPLLISFFQNLDHMIQEDPKNASKIEAWIQSQKASPDYYYYFFFFRTIGYDFYMENTPDHKEICDMIVRCNNSLKALGLEKHTVEVLPPKIWTQVKKEKDEQKDTYQERCQDCLFVLRPFYKMLQSLPPQLNEESRQAIKTWFSQFKTQHLTYKNPFFFAPSLIYIKRFLIDILNDEELIELEQLHDFCRKKLRDLKLDEYIEERPATLSPEQRKLRDQLINEVEFFRSLNGQLDVVTWLQENSSKADYPLLWGQQRSLHLESYSDGIDPIILKAWKHDFSECQTRLAAYGLQSYLHIDEIPAGASLQLRSFLVSDLCNEIQDAIKDPSAASSLVLTQHLRFYLKKYDQTVKRLIPSELLSQWKEAFSDLPEEAPSLPNPKVIQAATLFYRDLFNKSKEGNEAAKQWLDEKKADVNYDFPFYHSLYWQTLVNGEGSFNFTVHCASHKRIVQWAYLNDQGARLFETPPDLTPGLCQLVHRLTEDLVLFELPETPVPVKTPSPKPLHPLLVHKVDEEAFKRVILELAPHMAPVLQKQDMFTYWKNTLLDCAVFFCLDTMAVYDVARTKHSKKEVLAYFTTLKSRPGFENQVTLFSTDYVPIVKQLAPLLPKDLAKDWNNKYGKFHKHLIANDIQDDSYIDVKAPPFFKKSALIFNEQFKDAFKFFENLEKFKDNESKIRELTTQFSHLHYFWFAKEFDHLCIGFDVKETDLGTGRIKRFKSLFEQLKPRLQELKLEHLLTEAAPTRNIL